MVPSSVNSIMACDRLIASTLPCKSRVLCLRVGVAEFDDLFNQDIDFLRSGWFIFTIDADAQCRAPAVQPVPLATQGRFRAFAVSPRTRDAAPNEASGHLRSQAAAVRDISMSQQ